MAIKVLLCQDQLGPPSAACEGPIISVSPVGSQDTGSRDLVGDKNDSPRKSRDGR